MAARHIHVTGRVQGVGFRHFTKLEARRLGLAGWVRNLPDGRVEVWAEGDEDPLGRLVAWLHAGPREARVERVDARDVEPTGLDRFSVRRE